MTILVLLLVIIPILWIVGMIKPTLYKMLLRDKATRKIISIIFVSLWVVDFIAIAAVAPPVEKTVDGNKNENKEVVSVENTENKTNTQEEKVDTTTSAVSYEIVKIEDMSRKAMGDKSLSDYTTAELKKLPTNKRMSYKVVVPTTIKVEQIKPTVDKIISDLTNKDKDIDEIILDLYSDKEITSGPYDVANAIWAPYGDLGNVDAKIARDNDRSTYQTTIKIKDNLENYLSQKSLTEDRYGLSEDKRKEFFKAMVATQDRAHAEADKKYSIDNASANEYKAVYEKNSNEYDRLQTIYHKQLLTEWGLTETQAKSISDEAFKENWPLD